MKKKEILELINQQIEIAIDKLKQELEVKEVLGGESEKKAKFKSLQHFIDEKKPRKVTSEEMPVLAYYLREIDKRRLRKVDEKIMKVTYKRTSRSRPKRIRQALIDSPYFDKAPKKKGFYGLNDDGDYFVEVLLEERKKKTHGK